MKTTLLMILALGVSLHAGAQNTSTAPEPYRVEVTFSKTLHILFPTTVRYVDLGSSDIIADKADGAENVVRIKAAVRGFEGETNFSVITADGVFYSFNAVYANDPAVMSLRMEDWLHKDPYDAQAEGQMYIRQAELGNQTPLDVGRALYTIYDSGRHYIKTIGSKRYGIQLLLCGIYVQDGLFYFHLRLRNTSPIDFDVDHIRFRIADRKVVRRTAQQQTFIEPVREYAPLEGVKARQTVWNVYALRKFTLPDDKVLIVDLFERGGGRGQSFTVQNADLINARSLGQP